MPTHGIQLLIINADKGLWRGEGTLGTLHESSE